MCEPSVQEEGRLACEAGVALVHRSSIDIVVRVIFNNFSMTRTLFSLLLTMS
jgi:hypothetical protein